MKNEDECKHGSLHNFWRKSITATACIQVVETIWEKPEMPLG